jgi:hypothetical protein
MSGEGRPPAHSPQAARLNPEAFVRLVSCAPKAAVSSCLLNRWGSRLLAQMRPDRIELRLSLEAKRKTSTRDEYFAF